MMAQVKPQNAEDFVELWQPDLPWLKSLEIDIMLSGLPRITMNVEAPYEDGIALMESDLFEIGAVVKARMGYANESVFTPWYYGLMIEPQADISPDGVNFTLTYEVSDPIRTEGFGQYQDTTPLQIIKDVMGKYGFRFVVEAKSDSPLNQEIAGPVNQGGKNDWFFARKVGNDANADVFLGSDKDGESSCYILDRQVTKGRAPKRTFRMFGQFNAADKVYPLLSFSTTNDVRFRWNPSTARGVATSDYNPDSKELETTTADAGSEGQDPSLNPKSGVNPSGDSGTTVSGGVVQGRGTPNADEVGKLLPLSSRTENLQSVVTAAYNMGQKGAGIEATLMVFGNPYVFPGDLIFVEGVSKRYDAVYWIQGVTHNMDSSGWMTNVKVVSWGTYPELAQALADAAGDVNKGQVSSDPEGNLPPSVPS